MATLRLYQRFELESNGQVLAFGSRAAAREVSVDGHISDETKQLADSTTWDVWAAGTEEALADFDIAGFVANKNVLLEITVDENADAVGAVVCAIELQANREFILSGGDDAISGHQADFGQGSEYVINRIRIRNASGEAAIVRAVLVT